MFCLSFRMGRRCYRVRPSSWTSQSVMFTNSFVSSRDSTRFTLRNCKHRLTTGQRENRRANMAERLRAQREQVHQKYCWIIEEISYFPFFCVPFSWSFSSWSSFSPPSLFLSLSSIFFRSQSTESMSATGSG